MTSREKRLVNTLTPRAEIKAPIATDMFLPNSSKVMGADFKLKAQAYAKGSIIFSDGVHLAEDNSNLHYDDTLNALGIGTTDFNLVTDTVTVPLQFVTHNDDAEGADFGFFKHAAGSGADSRTGSLMFGNKSRGTQASPTTVQDGDIVFTLSASAYDGTNYINNSRIDFHVQGTVATAEIGSRLTFLTVADGAQAVTERLRIDNAGTIKIAGSIAINLVSKTANYTATTLDHTILCGAGNESFTVTLPAASTVTNIIYNIKNIGTGTITIDGNAAETIDGATTATISLQFDSITIQCDGSNWHVI